MTLSTYLSFFAVAAVVVLVPGPDFAVVTKNTLAGGRARGLATSCGVSLSNAVQGAAAVAGLGAVIVKSQPVFQTIRWAGVAYLLYLAVQSLRSAIRGEYAHLSGDARSNDRMRGLRQGFLSNVTNPKVLVFYLAVLPQFLGSSAQIWAMSALALTHAMLSLAYLAVLVIGMDQAKVLLARRPVRRILDAATGVALLAFGGKLAIEHR